GISILITCAPSAPNTQVQYGPASMCVRSRTSMPERGPLRALAPKACVVLLGLTSCLFTFKLRLPFREKGVKPFPKITAAEYFTIPTFTCADVGRRCGHALYNLFSCFYGQRRVACQCCRHLLNRCFQTMGLDSFVDESDRQSLGRFDQFAGHEHLFGCGGADELQKTQCVGNGSEQTKFRDWNPKLRRADGDSEAARRRHNRTTADRMALNHRDDRLRYLPQRRLEFFGESVI